MNFTDAKKIIPHTIQASSGSHFPSLRWVLFPDKSEIFIQNHSLYRKENEILKWPNRMRSFFFGVTGVTHEIWSKHFLIWSLYTRFDLNFFLENRSKIYQTASFWCMFRQNAAKCGKMRQNAAHVAMLRLLKETWGNSFSAVWAARKPSKAAFFTEFQIKNV